MITQNRVLTLYMRGKSTTRAEIWPLPFNRGSGTSKKLLENDH